MSWDDHDDGWERHLDEVEAWDRFLDDPDTGFEPLGVWGYLFTDVMDVGPPRIHEGDELREAA